MGAAPHGSLGAPHGRWVIRPSEREDGDVNAPMNPDETLPMTAEGYGHLCRELATLREIGRRELGERMRDARGDGDLTDNPTLQDLLEEQVQLERRIALLDAQLAAAEIVTPAADGRVGIGSVVRVRDTEGAAFELELVGPLESDALNGRISMHAPVGRALVGHRVGAHVEVTTPRGRVTLEIVSVRARRGSTGVGVKGNAQGTRVGAPVNVASPHGDDRSCARTATEAVPALCQTKCVIACLLIRTRQRW